VVPNPRGEPQGLKPAAFVVLIGTTEVVPFPVAVDVSGYERQPSESWWGLLAKPLVLPACTGSFDCA